MSMNPSQPGWQPVPPPVAAAAPSIPVPHKETPKASDPYKADVGHIGKSVQIKGELTGSEDLYLDGQIEGKVDLRDHSLIIGPNGKIKAGNLRARSGRPWQGRRQCHGHRSRGVAQVLHADWRRKHAAHRDRGWRIL